MTDTTGQTGADRPKGGADTLLDRSAAEFAAIVTGDGATVPRAVLGLRYLLWAVETPTGRGASQESGARVSDAIHAAAMIVSDSAAGAIEKERAWIGMAAAAAIARLFGRPFDNPTPEAAAAILDRVDHAALLAADLDSMLRRQRMAARGHPFVRQIARAWDAGASLY